MQACVCSLVLFWFGIVIFKLPISEVNHVSSTCVEPHLKKERQKRPVPKLEQFRELQKQVERSSERILFSEWEETMRDSDKRPNFARPKVESQVRKEMKERRKKRRAKKFQASFLKDRPNAARKLEVLQGRDLWKKMTENTNRR
eukprot:CAMPEP_0201506604 /NCGR_PEP_ID=MMETSP0161_2-20130828/508_1 /ASSEMBLY_ACC=CAM_ASM_000251 /TAXON_ID=180227 /ORGANISM="Neoparamoeba aestuarina, Strain SoJaBio B1-5/56/2" /LENGTH=143 /DNA_ID=CAMNT_0047900747 /DNA_START=407 /DNA_END=838 /DNA_ORIENTATION=+